MNETESKFLTRDFPFEAKALNDNLGTFSGYASTYDADLQMDIVMPGAFRKTLAAAEARRASMDGTFLYPLLWQHKHDEPIGGLYRAEEDQHGLYIEGMIDLETAQGRRAYSAMKAGYLNCFSIGYRPIKDRMGKPNLRVLEEISLIEVSLVTFAANPQAQVTGVKMARDAWFENLVNDMKRTAERLGAKRRSNGMSDFDEAAFGGHTDRSPYREPPLMALRTQEHESYRIVPGEDPQENPKAFERSLRAQLREEDPDLYNLTPGGRAYNAEIARRQAVREERRRLEREALAADRKAIADARIEPLETYTVEQLAEKTGVDIVWLTRFFQTCISRGEVTPAVEGTLILRGCDYGTLGRRHHEEFETQFVRAGHKRVERLAQEKRSA